MNLKNDQNESSFIIKPLDEFNIPNLIEPHQRNVTENNDTWMLNNDVQETFQYCQVYHNLNKYKHTKNIQVATQVNLEKTKSSQYEVLVIQKSDVDKNIQLLFSFNSLRPRNTKIDTEPSCFLQKYDFEQNQSIFCYEPLRGHFDSQHMKLSNQNHVFRINVNSVMGYQMHFACNSTFEIMSQSKYLEQNLNYSVKPFSYDLNTLEANTFNVFTKFRIFLDGSCEPENFQVRLKESEEFDLYLMKYMRFKLIKKPANKESLINSLVEGIVNNLSEKTSLNVLDQSIFSVTPGQEYVLQIEGQFPYPLNESKQDVEFLTKGNLMVIEQLEITEPLEYNDKYQINKYGIIFREKVFINQANQASFQVRIAQAQAAQQIVDPKAKKGNDVVELIEKPLKNKRLIKLELLLDDKLIVYAIGQNHALISNVFLEKIRPEQNYYLQCSFDMREWPQCQQQNEETTDLNWFLRLQIKLFLNYNYQLHHIIYFKRVILVNALHQNNLINKKPGQLLVVFHRRFLLEISHDCHLGLVVFKLTTTFLIAGTTETLAILKDTTQIDREKEIKKSWEDQQPGRSEKSKIARQKYLLMTQVRQGVQLKEEELQLLNEARVNSKNKQETAAPKGGKGAPPKKDEKKGKDAVVEVKEKVVEVYPKSDQHQMLEIHSFLNHLEQERVLEVQPPHAGYIHVRSEQNLQELNNKLNQNVQEFKLMIETQESHRTKMVQAQTVQNENLLTQIEQNQINQNQQFQEFLKSRSDVQKELQNRQNCKNQLIQMCKEEKVRITELETLISEAAVILYDNPQLIKVAQKLCYNQRIHDLVENLKNSVEMFELATIQQCINDVNQYSVDIDDQLYESAMEIIEESKANPKWLEDKQNEAKKAKGGKKK